ncbi:MULTISPECIES: 5'-nucleotidase, lipoprotein e(P4) family [Myroides]|uniref:5'-nucleotidase, lipoprotein e(P4) family n=1 Tax=Myroides albus TaxID=2562892 RepID=A0A6I3LMN7_9FLAO|nr:MULTISPECIES: 5'-nucleotidase, lipoprotein e(P4) family [Myroides]MTG98580.1 5'-nucleotidase, lipoprotein e(P4) family [Myroides albus]MVX36036.1 5'-nucleotidase, lipoprotein e(P4) family [Myroides sp. LoEW2-1]
MLKRSFLIAGLAFATLTACKSVPQSVVATNDNVLNNIEVNGKLYAAVFQQNAAEYQALCAQAFNIATLQLDLILQENHDKPIAIVTDIDETFLDNSPYAVKTAREGKSYDQTTWTDWTSKGEAIPLLGSQEFFNYAASKGVEIFYITNRNQNDKPGTMKNLVKYNYPFADEEHVIVRTAESSKETRRQKLSETHEIVMLLGDNLSDFSTLWDKKPQAERIENVKNNREQFGKKFIVLPNTGYGDWEAALFQYRKDLSKEDKDKIYNKSVKGF